MLSRTNSRKIWQTAILPVVDFISLFIGIWVVYLIRYQWFDENFLGTKQLPYQEYFLVSLILPLIVIIIYGLLGVYEINTKKPLWQRLFNLGFGILVVLLSIITYFFFYEFNQQVLPRGVPISRFILATGGFFAFYFVLLARGLIWAIEQILYAFGKGKIQVAIIGDKEEFLTEQIRNRNDVYETLKYDQLTEKRLDKLKHELATGNLAEIYILRSSQWDAELALWCERYKASFIFSPEGIAGFQSFGLKPLTIKKKVFLELVHSNLDGWAVVFKRIFDLAFALVFIALFWWLYLLIAIVIKLDSPGSVFYLSERVAPNGKVFQIWKFRRLKQEFCTSEKDPQTLEFEKKLIEERNMRQGVLYKIEDDPRATRVGQFLEKYSLDEIPQIINVLKGDLSLVGPRPHQPREVAKYQEHHYKVLNIKPGVTGLAQINGRSDLSFEDEVRYDVYYLEHWSFWLDIWIILMTPWVVIAKKHRG
jgi:exopolysaccharide biosynthesis polyprenyl glycosylphosphotransferase